MKEESEVQVNENLKTACKIYLLANVVSELLNCCLARSCGIEQHYFDPSQRASQDLWEKSEKE